jgi:hypothetical protein
MLKLNSVVGRRPTCIAKVPYASLRRSRIIVKPSGVMLLFKQTHWQREEDRKGLANLSFTSIEAYVREGYVAVVGWNIESDVLLLKLLVLTSVA